MDTSTLCLCGSGLAYQNCCGLFHSGEKIPATAEALMRSRYTAYALQNGAYLQATWEASKRPASIDFSKENITWLKLEITETKKGGPKDSKGLVVFKAYFEQDGEEHLMSEISRFTKIDGRWFYLDGTIKSIAKVGLQTNLGRNALCACGSGKKFKRCCGAAS
ncbi:MAG: YchJ family protein [Methylococcales bacterium]|nr:YchJ family protein [Methylococcales bacterium]